MIAWALWQIQDKHAASRGLNEDAGSKIYTFNDIPTRPGLVTITLFLCHFSKAIRKMLNKAMKVLNA